MTHFNNLLELKTLEKEYSILLKQYKETLELQETLIQQNNNEYINKNGYSWWGTSALNEGIVDNVNDCQIMCMNNTKCSGATFNTKKHYCWTRSGLSNITLDNNDNIAILTKQQESLSILNSLNQKLQTLHTNIIKQLNALEPYMQIQEQNNKLKQQQLNEYYNTLQIRKHNIEKQLESYIETLTKTNNSSLYVRQQNISYYLWIFIVVIIALLTLYAFV